MSELIPRLGDLFSHRVAESNPREMAQVTPIDRDVLMDIPLEKALRLINKGDTTLKGKMALYSLVLKLYSQQQDSKKHLFELFKEAPWRFTAFVFLLAFAASLPLAAVSLFAPELPRALTVVLQMLSKLLG